LLFSTEKRKVKVEEAVKEKRLKASNQELTLNN